MMSILMFNISGILSGNDEDNDLLLAQMLQLEFDKEYDDFVKSKEKVFNQNSNGMDVLFAVYLFVLNVQIILISFFIYC